MTLRRTIALLARCCLSPQTLTLNHFYALKPLPLYRIPKCHRSLFSISASHFRQIPARQAIFRPFSMPGNSKSDHDFGEELEEDDDADEESEEDDDADEGSEEDDESDEEEGEGNSVSRCVVERADSAVAKAEDAANIGYKVIGSLGPSDRPFKSWEPVFAVVQIGSHQFKVCNGDSIYTERLKYCEVNDKLILNKVLMLGSKTQTIIGRPTLPDVAVHAVVEEHALDAKVIIFKKKRRKNYRRTKGHRQELTKLRITDIEGIDKPEAAPAAA
ncbi:50S ribosomal protein L21, mitochondrial [Amborella trichopoda]|uniref:Large ribosomal subunit protein bL21m n=1 Tax=Amborella trichopoda TaxID=13333 RepID=U5DDA4_AMBTC|nr:50S ribosomal protein L21, mitochondrial [Amborella trichopoda]ERN20509.1 hypothetical protein AMTR_s00068p00183630 [Amborella trichopoda]|eukprot:XP_006859042.1 50S ribosomal protein L21, mitochondrial [Amborella trichopoda]